MQQQSFTSLLILGSNKQGQLGITQQSTDLKEHNYGVKIETVACGSYFTVLLLENQQCYVMGFQMTKMIDIQRVDQISCGAWHIVIRAQNILYGWGNNDDGQLGLGDFEPRTDPTALQINGQVVCGGYHTIIFNKIGYAFGRGTSGQLCKQIDKSNIPIQLPYTNITMVAAGETQTLIVSDKIYENNKLINFQGQIRQLACNRIYSAILTEDAVAYFWDRENNFFQRDNVDSISMFGDKCYLIRLNQTVTNLQNEIVINQLVKSVHTGELHALFVLPNSNYESTISDSLLLSQQEEEKPDDKMSFLKYQKKIAELQLQLAKKDAQIAQLQRQLKNIN